MLTCPKNRYVFFSIPWGPIRAAGEAAYEDLQLVGYLEKNLLLSDSHKNNGPQMCWAADVVGTGFVRLDQWVSYHTGEAPPASLDKMSLILITNWPKDKETTTIKIWLAYRNYFIQTQSLKLISTKLHQFIVFCGINMLVFLVKIGVLLTRNRQKY